MQEGDFDLEVKLRFRENYWQEKLFTLSHGMNSTSEWYSNNREGYREKEIVKDFIIYFYCACY